MKKKDETHPLSGFQPTPDNFIEAYWELNQLLNELPDNDALPVYRYLCLNDLYFMLRHGCSMEFLETEFMFERCQYVDHIERTVGLNNHLFLWFREAGKSTLLNTGKNLQAILRNPEHSTLILSNTAPGAKDFLRSIKLELENNERLIYWFNDILYENPDNSPSWSLDKGLIVKRKTNRKEPTIFAGGLVDSQPTRVHCERLVYDDVVTPESVTTDAMIKKTTQKFMYSFCLGKNLAGDEGMKYVIGTRFADGDTYGDMIESGQWTVDLMQWHTGDNETPRAHTKTKILELQNIMSKYEFNTQYNLDPTPQSERKFDKEMQKFEHTSKQWNYIMLCDPAGEGKSSREHDVDNTAMIVIGRDWLGKEYIADAVYGNIKLLDRIDIMFSMVRKYGIEEVWYEKVGKDSDIATIRDWQTRKGLYFTIHEYSPRKYGPKHQRIEHVLMPRIATGKLRCPNRLVWQNPSTGEDVDIVAIMNQEMKRFPHGKHDDFIDCLAQLGAVPEYGSEHAPDYEDEYIPGTRDESISDIEVKRRKKGNQEVYALTEYL